ncbi:AMP-binding protein [candidate division WOR-3 bacterium]|nr:AMP-binding protein [candidate division WOR-3 bacterium]
MEKVEYERELREFEWNIPADYNIFGVVRGHAEKNPDKVAIFWENEKGESSQLSYKKLVEGACRFGNILARLGVKKGDPVLHIIPRLPSAYIIQLGTFAVGGVAVPCTEMLRAKEIEYRSRVSSARVIVAHIDNTDTIDQIRDSCPLDTFIVVGGEKQGWISFEKEIASAPLDPPSVSVGVEDPLTINFTSGTTGEPKPVMHKHRWLYAHSIITARYWYDIQPDDIIWSTTGPGWAMWYWAPIGIALNHGVSQLTYNGKFDPEKYLQLLAKYKITKLGATPTEYRIITALPNLEQFKLPDLRSALSAGEPLNVEPIDRFKRAFGVTIRDAYGQTETVCLVSNYPGLPVRPGSMGKPTPGLGATVIDETGNPVPKGSMGEIAIRQDNPGIFDGYWKRPVTRSADGWHHTGDLVRLDKDGYIYFEGRTDDVIITSGYRIGPFEVEDALVSHPAVLEAAVVAAPDRKRGEIVKAFVILDNGYSPSDELVEKLQKHVKTVAAPYKYPRAMQFVSELPKTISGKIKRAELKRREWEGWDRG